MIIPDIARAAGRTVIENDQIGPRHWDLEASAGR